MNSNVIFEPFGKQEEFINAVFSGKYSFLCYGGSMGGGKTYVCLSVLILLCKAYPGSKWCVIRDSVPTLKRTTLESFKKVVPTNFIANYNQNDQIYTFTNGSQILFMAENFEQDKEFHRFRGLEVNGFLLEQIEELQEGLLSVCFIRAGRHKIDKMPPPMIIANVNPTLLWPKKKVYDPWSKNQLPADWFYLPARIYDNPTLANDDRYMHNVTAHLDDITRQQQIEGDWEAFKIERQFLYKFNKPKHQISEYTPNIHLPLTISFDFNVEPMTSLVGQKINEMTGRIFKEFEIETGSTEEMCDLLKVDLTQWYLNLYVTGDATGRNRTSVTMGNLNHYRVINDAFQLGDSDLLVPSVNPSHKDSRVLGNSVLQHADLQITENCEKTIRDCMYAQVDEFGQLIKTKEQGRHFFDNFRYMYHAFYPEFIKHPERYHNQE